MEQNRFSDAFSNGGATAASTTPSVPPRQPNYTCDWLIAHLRPLLPLYFWSFALSALMNFSLFQASVSSFNQVKETSLQCHICSCFWSENASAINILPPPDCLNMGTAGVISGVPPAVDEHTSPPQLCIQSNNHQPSVSPPFGIFFSTEQPKPALNNLPLWQENQDFGAELGEPNFMGALTQQESLEVGNMAQHNLILYLLISRMTCLII